MDWRAPATRRQHNIRAANYLVSSRLASLRPVPSLAGFARLGLARAGLAGAHSRPRELGAELAAGAQLFNEPTLMAARNLAAAAAACHGLDS